MKLRSGQYGAPVKLDVAELAVDVVDMLSELLPTVRLEAPLDNALGGVPDEALLNGELVATAELAAVRVVDVETTLELETIELTLADETDGAGEVGEAVLELVAAMIEDVVNTDEEVELKVVETELKTAMLEVEVSPDNVTELTDTVLELDASPDELTELEGTVFELEAGPEEKTAFENPVMEPEIVPEEATELGSTMLELWPPGLDGTDWMPPPAELEVTILELIEEL